ncbi:hypothetical protein ACFVT5_09660 [Streptomyces sp. NPDC058001]|uniref:AraC-like ligand-binding domain-containing protein n=1 Tax=Streptomyces sp. NPDC058001 TaxID=3346300 RepID=UPI0036E69974
MSVLGFPDLRSVRTHRLIQRSDPELWEVGAVLDGAMTLEQARSRVSLSAGDVVVWDSSREFDSAALDVGGRPRLIVAHLPRHAVPVPEQVLRGLVARELPARAGAGALVTGFLRGLAEQATALGGTRKQAEGLGATTIDLVAAFLSGMVDADMPGPARHTALLLASKRFIRRNLGAPELSPTTIAAAHHMSLRSLHYVFQREEQTVAGFVREERLERCRAELTAPGLVAPEPRATGDRAPAPVTCHPSPVSYGRGQ